MTHYYFDVKNGITSRDHGGLDLDCDADAIAKAKVIAEEVGLQCDRHHSRHISVIREDGWEVTQVPIRAAPRRV